MGLMGLMLGAVALTGCALFKGPVPTTTVSANIGGQKMSYSSPKDTTATNVVFEVSSNGTARLSIGAITANNNSNVIGSSYAGEAAMIHELGAQFQQAVQTGISAAGTAAKAP